MLYVVFFAPNLKYVCICKVCLGQDHLGQGLTAMPFNQSSAKLGVFLVRYLRGGKAV